MSDPVLPSKPPSLLRQWLVWFAIGATSFGGGAATILLMRREWAERRGWVSVPFFERAYAMSQIVPGINIFALAIQLGKAVAGWRGIAIALVGLLLPAVAITTALTELFAFFQGFPLTRAALAGVAPGTAGLTLVLGLQALIGGLRTGRGGWFRLRDAAVIIGCILGLAVFEWPAPFILIGAAAYGALLPSTSAAFAPRRR